MSLKSLVAAAPSGRSRPVLLDDVEYSTTVVRRGTPIPWTDAATLASHFGQVAGLLGPDALWIDIHRLQDTYIAEHPDLAGAMSARTRVGYPLRVLLGDQDALTATIETLKSVAATAHRELLLHLPSPAAWLASAHRLAGTPLDGVDADRADAASMYIAEWLGHLGVLPVTAVLLDSRGAPSDIPEQLDSYTAIGNVASHFDWSVAMRQDGGVESAAGEPSIGLIPVEYWAGDGTVPETDVLIGEIPASASPERVLDQLAKLH